MSIIPINDNTGDTTIKPNVNNPRIPPINATAHIFLFKANNPPSIGKIDRINVSSQMNSFGLSSPNILVYVPQVNNCSSTDNMLLKRPMNKRR